MLARFDEAAEIAREASGRLLDLTGDDAGDAVLGQIAATAGRHEDAAVHLRRYCDVLEARGLRGYLSTFAPALGRRSACSDATTRPSRSPGSDASSERSRDLSTQALWRQVQALVDAHRGHYLEAEKTRPRSRRDQ